MVLEHECMCCGRTFKELRDQEWDGHTWQGFTTGWEGGGIEKFQGMYLYLCDKCRVDPEKVMYAWAQEKIEELHKRANILIKEQKKTEENLNELQSEMDEVLTEGIKMLEIMIAYSLKRKEGNS